MFAYRSRTSLGSSGLWLISAAFAAALVLSTPGARAQGGASTALDIPAANDALVAERLLAQFYNLNSGKPYLTGTLPVSTAPGTPAPTSPYTPAGFNPPGSSNGTLLTATLTGSGETPAVNTPASGSASFLLSMDHSTVSYQVTITGLTGPPTALRIRQGPAGQPNGIILYFLNFPDNGVSSGDFGPRPEDVPTLLSGGLFLEITTSQFPAGEIRGQIETASGTPPPVVTPPVVTPSPVAVVPAGVNQAALQSMVGEIRTGHNAHVMTLEQLLGANAPPMPTFQNLDAPTLTQFLTMAQTFEDFAVGVAQNGIDTILAGPAATTPGSVPAAVNQPLMAAVVAVLADDGRYAGGIRAFEKIASTALGGNPNLTLSENGQPFNTPRTQAQLNAFLQPYLTAPTTAGKQ